METRITHGSVVPSSRNSCPTTDEVRRDEERQRPIEIAQDVEAAIVSVLTRPLVPGESQRAGADRREQELREIFVALSAAQSLALDRRLGADRDADRIAVAFRRLTGERRHRLRACLAELRRRVAAAPSGTALRQRDAA